MKNKLYPLILITTLLISLFLLFHHANCTNLDNGQKQVFIVHLAKWQMPSIFQDHILWFQSILASVSFDAKFIYTYTTVIHGFAVQLTPGKADALLRVHGVLKVLPEKIHELHTTRTPLFLGLDDTSPGNLLRESGYGNDVVIGLMDTGVWPESRSFNDTGLSPVPVKWKGTCIEGANFSTINCNRKLIGARFFSNGYEAVNGPIDSHKESRSPRDDEGHGTHTSTTAGGAYVGGASLFGYANGTARGIAPRARIAMYKVCWLAGCSDSDILAGMEAAINDGVDIISVSLGASASDYWMDVIAIGAFAAIKQGIFVSCSAGNSGPNPSTVGNNAPWIATIGAGTIDRDFPSYALLGNRKNFTGTSLDGSTNDDQLPSRPIIPLIYAGNASNSMHANLCFNNTLSRKEVAGKIVVCDRGYNSRLEKGFVVKAAGGVGMILTNTEDFGEEVIADPHFLPALHVGFHDGVKIKNYIFSNPNTNPTATIVSKGYRVGIKPAPMVAGFSSRGPNPITTKILKPDMFAPGVSILAGWTGSSGPSGLLLDNRIVEFNIISGTSMSCPHVAGIAALLHAAHPEWSPASIRSALMTTAYTLSNAGLPIVDLATSKPSTPFDHGSGHVNPQKALDPGLVYDLTVDDYLKFLCGLNYSPVEIYLVSQRLYNCIGNSLSAEDFNYPSFVVQFRANSVELQSLVFKRTVTNVGQVGNWSYAVKVTLPASSSMAVNDGMDVSPTVLNFTEKNEKKTYVIRFTTNGSLSSGTSMFGGLVWFDGVHNVRSPIVFVWK